MGEHTSIPISAYTILQSIETQPASAAQQALDYYASAPPGFWAEYVLGATLLAWERIPEAQPYLERAAAASAALPALWQLHCERLLLIQHSLAEGSTTTEPWERLISQYQALGEQHEAVHCAIYLARAWHSKRDPQTLEVIEQWLPHINLEQQRSDAARMLRVQGAALISQGQFAAGTSVLEQAIAWFEQAQQPIEIAKCYIELAWSAIYREELTTAQELLDLAYPPLSAQELPLQLAFYHLNQAILCHLQGQFALALSHCQQARDRFSQVRRTIDIGSCEGTLGTIYQQIGHLEAAQAHYLLALEIFQE